MALPLPMIEVQIYGIEGQPPRRICIALDARMVHTALQVIDYVRPVIVSDPVKEKQEIEIRKTRRMIVQTVEAITNKLLTRNDTENGYVKT